MSAVIRTESVIGDLRTLRELDFMRLKLRPEFEAFRLFLSNKPEEIRVSE